MIKSIGKLTIATILAALVVGVPLGASAQDKAAPENSTPAAPARTRALPFHGKLESVDKVNKTITLQGKTKRTFEVTSETKITKGKDRKPATLDDGAAGDDVSGSYTKSADGKTLKLRSLRFEPNGPTTK
ncbi:MAG TPA: hypothetical protein VFB72_12060 [Verrucomicrobiae bacterium]|nr:hypothetical protein [Verrucomicrobiae bacterium]